jgi:hypothetical protein
LTPELKNCFSELLPQLSPKQIDALKSLGLGAGAEKKADEGAKAN